MNYISLKIYQILTLINEIDTERSISKYCNELNTYLNNVTNITRDSSKELLFLITVRNSDFMYLLEKQKVP